MRELHLLSWRVTVVLTIILGLELDTILSQEEHAQVQHGEPVISENFGRAIPNTKPPLNDEKPEDFPSYDNIIKVENNTANIWDQIWTMTNQLTQAERLNRNYINDKFWPELLTKLRDSHLEIKEMDYKILFKRKPSALMDALIGITSLKDLWNVASKVQKTDRDKLSVRYMEMSSSASQMHRFYLKRIRDILRDEPRIGMVANSILGYKGVVWGNNNTESAFSTAYYINTPAQTINSHLYLDGTKSVFQGIREFLQNNPDIVLKAQYDGKVCEDNQTIFSIEPAGLDVPYYLLFHLCLVDIKFFSLMNFAHLYNMLYQGQDFGNQTLLRTQMRQSVQYKIDLFDKAFNEFLINTGPTYHIYPGITICDPLPTDNQTRTWIYDENYFKLTNFIKVFVAPEQELHKAGNCKQTCDMLDGTYKPCNETDTDCILDEEAECLQRGKRCNHFNPPCPYGQYQCQNSTSSMTVCPSKRPDRLYEYIKGNEFYFGTPDHECRNQTTSYKGGWTMEQDTLVDTPHFCEICSCYCFEPMVPYFGNLSVRYVNTEMVRSKQLLNYIIVGIKFEKIKDQIHIRIAEAKALPNRKVDMSTLEWTPIKYQTNPRFITRLDKDMRSINLDDVVVDLPNRVITGVKLYTDNYNGHVQYWYMGLAILSSEITMEGKVVPGTGKLRRNGNSTVHRNRYSYGQEPNGPNDPILAVGPSLPDTTSNQYAVFVGTSLQKDAAQSTIPFFDAQKLIRKESNWLKGIGIYHKSRPGFGGFLALKLIEHQNKE